MTTSIATCWRSIVSPSAISSSRRLATSLPRASFLGALSRSKCLGITSCSLRRAIFTRCIVQCRPAGISSMRDKREHTGRRPRDAVVRSLAPHVPLFHRLSRQTISAASAVPCLLIASSLISYTITSVSTLLACAVVDVETRFRAATETLKRRERASS